MKKNRITLTEEILKLASSIKVRDVEIPSEISGNTYIAAIENASVYGGSDLLEDASMILGFYDEHIEGTEENSNGVQFDAETENKIFTLHEFIIENLITIEELIHYWSNKGGLKPGTYNTITMEREN
jgi:hypothetical protein